MKVYNTEKRNTASALRLFICLGMMLFFAVTSGACGSSSETADQAGEAAGAGQEEGEETYREVSDGVPGPVPGVTAWEDFLNAAEGGGEYSSASDETAAGAEAESETESEAEAELTFADMTGTWYATSNVNIRVRPDTDSEILAVLYANQAVGVTGISDNGEWARADYQGQVCYIASAWLTDEEPSSTGNLSGSAGTGIYYSGSGPLICIDAGHQSKGSSVQEPIGPGSSTVKARVSGGTSGVSTGIPEYQLTLNLAVQLRDELLSRGYSVLMIRETSDVDISNAERAQIANDAGAAAFLRIHADGSDSPSARGASALCPTSSNPYCSQIYSASRSLSDSVLSGLCASTGAKNRGVTETDTMSGINWCTVPVTIIEVGFMTNAEEDQLMATAAYQKKIVQGLADGLDAYFGR